MPGDILVTMGTLSFRSDFFFMQAISVPVGVRPLYLAANIGCARPEAPLNSVLVQFDAHVSYLRLHHVIVKATSLSGNLTRSLCMLLL